MNANLLINRISKVVLISSVLVFSSVSLDAWTISVLNPSSTNSAFNVGGSSAFSVFRNYLQAESTLIMGDLATYNGTSDAVIVNLINGGQQYTTDELTKLSDLLNSNTRVLVFGESSGWLLSDNQLATLVNGTAYTTNGNNDQYLVNAYSPITDGVSNVRFTAPGGVTANGSNGISFFNDNAMSIWGSSNNFLLLMDINIFTDTNLVGFDSTGTTNNQLGQNTAHWLSGASIPEPSSYAMMVGLSIIGLLAIRRCRK